MQRNQPSTSTSQPTPGGERLTDSSLKLIEHALLGAKSVLLMRDASLIDGALEDINLALQQLKIPETAH